MGYTEEDLKRALEKYEENGAKRSTANTETCRNIASLEGLNAG